METHDDEVGSSRSKRPRQHETVEEDYTKQLSLRRKVLMSTLKERTTRYDKIQKNNLWLLSMFDARHQNGYANVAWVITRWMKNKGVETQKEVKFVVDGSFQRLLGNAGC
nr:hypothetical protein [Tanacetum cinerariifolium]